MTVFIMFALLIGPGGSLAARPIEFGTYSSSAGCEQAAADVVKRMHTWLSDHPQVLHTLSSDGRRIGFVCEQFYSE